MPCSSRFFRVVWHWKPLSIPLLFLVRIATIIPPWLDQVPRIEELALHSNLMKPLALTCCSLYCARRASSFFTFSCDHFEHRMTKRVLSTGRTAKTKSTKSSATHVADDGNGNAIKKTRLSAELSDSHDLADSVSNPWYTFFTKGDAEYNKYMATEWGFERRGDEALFEKLSLEGAQSGLSWLTVLRKRPAYRRAFYDFDPVKVSLMTDEDVQKLIETHSEDPRDQLVRHRGKIESVINNAKCIVQLRAESSTKDVSSFGVFDDLIWSFVDHKPILNRFALSQMPSKSKESEAMSKELKKRGFKFVGPITCYSMMQALGMIIDHPLDSPEWLAAYETLKQRPGGFQERSS